MEEAVKLHQWRRAKKLTQADAAELLGVSQPYLSLLEKGKRPWTLKLQERFNVLGNAQSMLSSMEDRLRSRLSALSYTAFSHIKRSRPHPSPEHVLIDALQQPTLDARITEAIPWLASHYRDAINWEWLVSQAKLNNFQNRLGFILELAPTSNASMKKAKFELDKARLITEATFCWDSMPDALRNWIRRNRSPEAEHWNIVTRLRPADFSDAN